MVFPKIDYKFWLSYWNESIGKGGVYTNKNIEKYIQFDKDINYCTSEIIELTSKDDINKKNILRVVDLIYSWGGPSGRMFYSKTKGKISPREELETNEITYKTYLEGIEFAKQGKSVSIEIFNRIRGIGSSYASKHSYFWSINSPNPLIIVDSKISGALGYRTIDDLEKDFKYNEIVKRFLKKSQIEFNEKDPSKVERSLFAFHNFYFLNDNSNWKNKDQFKDYKEAEKIAKILFENNNN